MTPPPAISIHGLHFSYVPQVPVLNGLSLSVPAGSIYGFLGGNGAGKTTTIRALLGLLRPHRGEIGVHGCDIRTRRLDAASRVGALIESPALHGHLTGRENLRVAAAYLQVPPARIGEVLETVGLAHAADATARSYSTGMKQRLGLALALLRDPDVLVLDEPTNGLDPAGIIEIRNVLTGLRSAGKTVFLSSHLLAEIERIATHVGIISGGRTLFEGTIEQLREAVTGHLTLEVTVEDARSAARLLAPEYRVSVGDDRTLLVELRNEHDAPGLVRTLVDRGVGTYAVTPRKSDLEQLFLRLTDTPGEGGSR